MAFTNKKNLTKMFGADRASAIPDPAGEQVKPETIGVGREAKLKEGADRQTIGGENKVVASVDQDGNIKGTVKKVKYYTKRALKAKE